MWAFLSDVESCVAMNKNNTNKIWECKFFCSFSSFLSVPRPQQSYTCPYTPPHTHTHNFNWLKKIWIYSHYEEMINENLSINPPWLILNVTSILNIRVRDWRNKTIILKLPLNNQWVKSVQGKNNFLVFITLCIRWLC